MGIKPDLQLTMLCSSTNQQVWNPLSEALEMSPVYPCDHWEGKKGKGRGSWWGRELDWKKWRQLEQDMLNFKGKQKSDRVVKHKNIHKRCFQEMIHLPISKTLICLYRLRALIIFWFNLYCIFFPLPFSPQQSSYCCPCPWVLFPFCLILLPAKFPLTAVICSVSVSLSLFCLLVKFVR